RRRAPKVLRTKIHRYDPDGCLARDSASLLLEESEDLEERPHTVRGLQISVFIGDLGKRWRLLQSIGHLRFGALNQRPKSPSEVTGGSVELAGYMEVDVVAWLRST